MRIFGIGFFLVLFVLTMGPAVFADVSPGDVIDKTNWQKAEGLLPEPVLNWVKKGDFILHDAQTGKAPDFISGLPFPEVDPEDPKAGQKFLYNKHYAAFNTGNQNVGFQAIWVGTGGRRRGRPDPRWQRAHEGVLHREALARLTGSHDRGRRESGAQPAGRSHPEGHLSENERRSSRIEVASRNSLSPLETKRGQAAIINQTIAT